MKKMRWPVLAAACLLLAGCGVQKYTTDFFAMDTFMTITAYGREAEATAAEAERTINEMENQLSRTRTQSDIARLNASGGEIIEVSEETMEILERARGLAEWTGGAFDPTIAALSDLWAIESDHPAVPGHADIVAARNTVGWEHLKLLPEKGQAQLTHGAKIDLGGIGKGAASDGIAPAFSQLEGALLMLGGNITVLGDNPAGKDGAWTVGVGDPNNSAALVGTLALRDSTVVTSGDYQRYFEQDGKRYHHIFDPATGYPAESGLRAVTVVRDADSSAEADALSTALFVMGCEKGMQFCAQEGVSAVFITTDKLVYVTDDLRDKFTFTGEQAGYRYVQ